MRHRTTKFALITTTLFALAGATAHAQSVQATPPVRGATSAQAASSAPPPPARDAERAPISIEYTVTRRGPRAATAISGQMVVTPRQPAAANVRAPRSAEAISMVVEARPQEDGTIVVRVGWHEVSAHGERVDWEPSVQVRHGASASAVLDWAGGGRTLQVRVR